MTSQSFTHASETTTEAAQVHALYPDAVTGALALNAAPRLADTKPAWWRFD